MLRLAAALTLLLAPALLGAVAPALHQLPAVAADPAGDALDDGFHRSGRAAGRDSARSHPPRKAPQPKRSTDGPAGAATAASPRPAAQHPSPGRGAALGFALPLAGRAQVVRPFDAPEQPWLAGHRGVDLAGRAEQTVLAAGTGVIAFAGVVAGRGVVTVAHSPTLRTTYEPVGDRSPAGTVVATGDPIGVLAAQGSHCAPADCLHWGAISGGEYLDPMGLLGHVRPILLPLD